MRIEFRSIVIILVLLGLGACSNPTPDQQVEVVQEEIDPITGPLFTLLDPIKTGVMFIHDIEEDAQVHYLNFVNVYNGGGVALGDINNDGLLDIYFTASQESNRLYLNKGNMQFEDITESAGVTGEGGWSTGIAMADVNSDGFLDIYVCRSFSDDDDKMRENLLYINNGDMTFSEKGAEYGVNDDRYAINAVFLDHDLDGDLDLYVGNFPRDMLSDPLARIENWNNPRLKNSNRLYVNQQRKIHRSDQRSRLT